MKLRYLITKIGLQNIRQIVTIAEKRLFWKHDGKIHRELKDGNTYQFIRDHLGSVRSVVNVSTGEIVQRIDYDEYGNITYSSNPDFTPFGFCGGLYDGQTKLIRFGARIYDGLIRRYTTENCILFIK